MARPKMAKQSTAGKKKRQPVVPTPVQEALQVTFVLQGAIKIVEIAYIHVCKLLAQVREEKMWAVLKHPDLDDYADKRLRLKRSSLYRYLRIYDWLKASHLAWLEPHPKGFIPELTDAEDLMWMEAERKRQDLEPARRSSLEALIQKALNGMLRDGELARWRRKGGGSDTAMKSLLLNFRRLRKRAAQVVNVPPKVLADMDDAIGEIERTIGDADKA